MTPRLVTAGLLTVLVAAGQKQANPTVDLNGGLQAQILTLGRNDAPHPALTATVKITNTGKDHAFLLLLGLPSAVDDAGGRFDNVGAVTGIANCAVQSNLTRQCVKVDDAYFFPFQNYTEIDPGKSITVHFSMSSTMGSKGGKVSLSAEMAYRFVKEPDLEKDPDVPDKQKARAVRFGNLSFEPVALEK